MGVFWHFEERTDVGHSGVRYGGACRDHERTLTQDHPGDLSEAEE